MTDFVWPPSCRQSSISWRNVSNTELIQAPLSGSIQASGRPGDRLACTITVENSSGAERRKLRALAALLRGALFPIYIPDLAFKRAGVWPGGELLTNTEFNGTTSWTAGGKYSHSASDGVLRATVIDGSQANSYPGYQAVSGSLISNYAPYVMRGVIRPGKGAFFPIYPLCQNSAGSVFATDGGYSVYSIAGLISTTFGFYDGSSVGNVAGDYLDILFASASRCGLVDGGGNALLRSDSVDVGGAVWLNTACGVFTNAATAPDGTVTAESVVENSATSTHSVSQTATRTASAVNYEAYGYFGRLSGTRDVEFVLDDAAGNGVRIQVNLSTGAIVIAATAIGSANDPRGFVTSAGNGWWRIHIGCLLPANTGLRVIAYSINAGATSYLGNGTSSIKAWRLGAKQDSSPSRPTQSIAAAIAAVTQSGGGLYVKGLPVSTSGLLREGDTFEIDKQMKFATASLDSDAAGCAYLQFEPPLARAVADNTPIIFQNPLCKMRLVGDAEYPNRPGGFSDFRFELVQDLSQ